MRYIKRFYDSDLLKEVDYEEALKTVLGTYIDNPETRAMLTIGNYIPCRFSELRVYDDNGNTAMAGLSNLLPDGMYWHDRGEKTDDGDKLDMAASQSKMEERMKMVKAMEYIARQINDEEIFYNDWLTLGVADGDIEYGDLEVKAPLDDDIALDYAMDDTDFAELMETFLTVMEKAKISGGLYCGGVVSK